MSSVRERFKKLFQIKKQKIDARRVICLILTFIAFGYIQRVVPQRIRYSITNSVSHNLFYLKPFAKGEEARKGDYVVFSIDTDYIPNCHPCKVLKQVGCVTGDTLLKKQGAFFCEDKRLGEEKLLGVAKTQSNKGVKVTPFDFQGRVPDDQIFAAGCHKDSYDSKYFGFVERNKIEAIAIPII